MKKDHFNTYVTNWWMLHEQLNGRSYRQHSSFEYSQLTCFHAYWAWVRWKDVQPYSYERCFWA